MLNGMPIDDIDATLHDDSDNPSNPVMDLVWSNYGLHPSSML